jgi:predicted Zn-dependent peptidase
MKLQVKFNSINKILTNNIKVIMIPMENTDIVSLGIFNKVGSRYENKKTSGIAHFLEHMIFKGTKNMSSKIVAEKLDEVGAKYNAETSYETTHYYVSGHKNSINLFIDILSDIYINPAFKEEDIITERGVIMEEFNMVKDEPSEIIQNLLHKIIFDDSSLKYPIIGTKENILSFTRKDFINFRKQFYVPNRTVIVIAGNFDNKKIFNKIKNKFQVKKYNNNSDIKLLIEKKENKICPNLIFKEKNTVSQTHVILSFNSESIFSEIYESYDLLSDILTSGSSSRLFDLLRNQLGVAYSVSAVNLSYTHEGAFIIHMGVDNNRVEESIKAVLSELINIKKNGISEKELQKAKQIRTTSMMLSLDSPSSVMNYYGINEIYFNIATDKHKDYTVETLIEKYNKIKLKSLNNLINDLFKKEKLNIIVYGKKKTFSINSFDKELDKL